MSIPQLIISLSNQGELITELPATNGSRRKINLKINQTSAYAINYAMSVLSDISKIEINDASILNTNKAKNLLDQLQNKIQAAQDAVNLLSNLTKIDNTVCDILLRILENRVASKHALGEDGNPTQQQVDHWRKHSGIFGNSSCPFCISEGKFEKGRNRKNTSSLHGLSEYEALRCGLISRGFTQSKSNANIFSKKNMNNIFLSPNSTIKDDKQIIWSRSNRDKLLQEGKLHATKHGFTSVLRKEKNYTVKTITKMVKETQIERLKRVSQPISF